MKSLFKNRYFLSGLILFVVGSGPLLVTLGLAGIGITDDPDPNPVWFGIMAMFTFWTGLILMVLGFITNRRDKSE